MLLHPWFFTENEGGFLKQWTYGWFNADKLNEPQNKFNTITVNGKEVHAFFFEDYVPGIEMDAWDVVNGYRQPLPGFPWPLPPWASPAPVNEINPRDVEDIMSITRHFCR